MENLDLKLKLFGGLPIVAKGYGAIRPLKIRDILDYGYSDYMKSLNIMSLDKRELFKEASESQIKDISMLEFFISSGDSEIMRDVEEALSLFLGGESYTDESESCVYVKINEDDIRVVNSKNFENIVRILKYQNYIDKFDEKEISEAPMDEKTRKFKERMKSLNKKVEDIKRKNDESDSEEQLDFYDILESLSSKSYSVNELNILDLTVYQVYRKFKRIDVLDRYDINIKSMLAGAKDIKLKHWSSKID